MCLALTPMDETPMDDGDASSMPMMGVGYPTMTYRMVDGSNSGDRVQRVEDGGDSNARKGGQTREERTVDLVNLVKFEVGRV